MRTKLQFDDADGIYHNDYDVVLVGLIEAGYQHDNTKVWKKKGFCPKWRYLVHTLLQCLSPKSGGWDQFSTELGCGILCLSRGTPFNWSKFIFDGMISNVEAKKRKFCMYPRFYK